MNDSYIVTTFVLIDELLPIMGQRDDGRCRVSAAEVLTVAIVAAKYFQNHHERALCILQRLGDIPPLSVSRFNRRLHALCRWLEALFEVLSDWLQPRTLMVIDSAATGMQECACPALQESARTPLLGLLCDERRVLLWLEAACGLYQ